MDLSAAVVPFRERAPSLRIRIDRYPKISEHRAIGVYARANGGVALHPELQPFYDDIAYIAYTRYDDDISRWTRWLHGFESHTRDDVRQDLSFNDPSLSDVGKRIVLTMDYCSAGGIEDTDGSLDFIPRRLFGLACVLGCNSVTIERRTRVEHHELGPEIIHVLEAIISRCRRH